MSIHRKVLKIEQSSVLTRHSYFQNVIYQIKEKDRNFSQKNLRKLRVFMLFRRASSQDQ